MHLIKLFFFCCCYCFVFIHFTASQYLSLSPFLCRPARPMCLCVFVLLRHKRQEHRLMYGPSVTWPPHDKIKCFNVLDASQREMDHQPLVFWTLSAFWHCCVSMKCLCVCVCFSAWHAVVAWLRSHAVWQHVIWTGLLNILMVPLTEGSRPERLGSGPRWPPCLVLLL